MDFSFGDITGKIMDKAEWVAWFLAAYSRYNGNLEQVFRNYTTFSENEGVLLNVRSTVDSIDHIMWKLWQSPHLYTSMFKISAGARIFMELFDIIPQKYAKTLEKVMMGAAVAALTLPGGGGQPYGGHNGYPKGAAYSPLGRRDGGYFTMPNVPPSTPTLPTILPGSPRPS